MSKLMDLPEIDGAREIHCYWPASGSSEVDTRDLIAQLRTRNVRIYLPVVVSFERSSDSERILEAEYGARPRLIPNRWGILEPASDSARSFACDVAIVPGFGASRSGIRVGYGWGYYDELLRDTAAPVIMPCFDACLLQDITADPRDRPVSCIVTETSVVRTGGTM